MGRLTGDEIVQMFLSVGTILVAARVLGELARKLGQPVVLGELMAGILLGPTVLGALSSGTQDFLFPRQGSVAIVLDGLGNLSIALFLLVAGMEVDLSSIFKRGRAALFVGAAGIALPFAVGFASAKVAPGLLGAGDGANPEVFALFFATAMSISALPVIAKTLMDLHIYKSDFGSVVIAAAVINDLIGWLIFAVILGQVERVGAHELDIGRTLLLTALFAVVMLTAARWLIHRSLPWILAHASFPHGVIGFALVIALFGAAFTEFIGVHAIFGAFLVGVAFGDSHHLRERTRSTITDFVSSIFAPYFFGRLGLRADFVQDFQPALCGVVLGVACIGKVLGCGVGARTSGMAWRESWAVGFAMNARGAMEMILGLLALQYGLIGEPMFVALVLMALVTSLISGPAMQKLLGRRAPRRIATNLSARNFLPRLAARDGRGAIEELCRALAGAGGIDSAQAAALVWEREQMTATGIGNGVAVPHARIPGLRQPLVALGLSEAGVDFDAHDGKPAQLVFVLLTPEDDDGAQLDLLADIGRTFAGHEARERALHVRSYTELLAVLRTG